MIDLRSDTVTRPTDAMRRAMADAEVGDACFDTDPTVERLERITAEILGKEAAVFVPSGTMANQIALRVHCRHGEAFICEQDCHIYQYEQGGFAALSGLIAQTVPGQGGAMQVEQMAGIIHPNSDHSVRTRLLCIENTHNRWGGRVQPSDDVRRLCNWARSVGLSRHLDGARLWNAAVATGVSEAELAEPFESVNVCFSKGLGAPVGSMLVGSADFIHEARRGRKLFGGGMRQAGIVAAGALHALEHHRPRLVTDHEHAQQLGQTIGQHSHLSIRGDRIDTNMVVFEMEPGSGSAEQFVSQLRDRGVDCFDIDTHAVRLVTHLDISDQQIKQACEAINRVAESVATIG
tara:strand:- start:35661 stop:36704 length:1044 start_codon:yes stop_codon:yes gene_type:complete